jgi:hypothetical protein
MNIKRPCSPQSEETGYKINLKTASEKIEENQENDPE